MLVDVGEGLLCDPQPFQTRGAPDTQFPVLAWDCNNRCGEVGDAACYLQ
jgi:hypothetical protein